MTTTKHISVRQLQHNLADYLALAHTTPLSITKHGQPKVIMLNPQDFDIIKKKQSKNNPKNLIQLPFVGMHKHKKSWENKKSQEIAQTQKHNAWYGK